MCGEGGIVTNVDRYRQIQPSCYYSTLLIIACLFVVFSFVGVGILLCLVLFGSKNQKIQKKIKKFKNTKKNQKNHKTPKKCCLVVFVVLHCCFHALRESSSYNFSLKIPLLALFFLFCKLNNTV